MNSARRRKTTPAAEPREEAGSARKMALSLLTRLCNLDRRVKGISRSVTGQEPMPRDPELPPRSLNEILEEALAVAERVTRTTNHVADRLGVGEV
jgi:hypothetical protein